MQAPATTVKMHAIQYWRTLANPSIATPNAATQPAKSSWRLSCRSKRGTTSDPERHADRKEHEHEGLRRADERLERRDPLEQRDSADEVASARHVDDAHRDDRAPPRIARQIDDKQAAQLDVLAQEPERLDDVLAQQRQVESAAALGGPGVD